MADATVTPEAPVAPAAPAAAVKEIAGKVISVEGEVVAVDTKTGATRTLHVGDRVFIGELITTAKGASVDLGMADGRNQEVGDNKKILLQHDVTSGAGNASTALDNAVHTTDVTANLLNNALQVGSTLNSVIQAMGSSSSSSSAAPPPNTFHSSGVTVAPPSVTSSVSQPNTGSMTANTIIGQTGTGSSAQTQGSFATQTSTPTTTQTTTTTISQPTGTPDPGTSVTPNTPPIAQIAQASAAADAHNVVVQPTISVSMPGAVSWNDETGSVPVSGLVTGTFRAGDTVTLTVGGHSYSGTVDAGGHYSIGVPGAALVGNSSVQAALVAHDTAGNVLNASGSASYTADVAPTISVSMTNVLSATDLTGSVPVSGQVTGTFKAGDTVTLTVGGQSFSGTVDAGGHYSIGVPGAALVGNTTVQAALVAHDASGNAQSVSASTNYTADIAPTISVSLPNVVSWNAETSSVPVSGQVTGTFKAGDTVTLTVGGQSFSGTVDAGGHYSIGVPGAALVGNTTVQASVVAHDALGNAQNASGSAAYTADVMPTISVSMANVVSTTDLTGSVPVSGQVTGTFKAGDTVTLTVGAHSFSGTVDAGGHYSIGVPGTALAGNTTVQAALVAHDAAGNTQSVTASTNYTADIAPTISVSMPNVVSWNDETGSVPVSGQVTGTFKAGDTVTLTVGGQSFSGTVDAGGHYSIGVPGTALAGNTTVQAALVAHDAAGNTQSVTASTNYTADIAPTISVSMPNVVSWNDETGSVPVSGQVTGTFKAGDTVTLTVGGQSFSGTVDAGGHYSIGVPGTALVGNTTVQAALVAHDTAGNVLNASGSASYTADVAPTISVSMPNVVSWNDEAGSVPVSGQVNGTFKAGDTVTLTVGSQSFSGTVDAGGHYSIGVPGTALVGNTALQASLVAHDAAGNTQSVSASAAFTVDTMPAITVSVPVNNEVTWTEQGSQVTVTGHVSGTFTAGDIVTLTVGNTSATGLVDASGNYAINMAGSALAGGTVVTAALAAHDAAGALQTVTTTQAYTVDTTPTVTVSVPVHNDVTWTEQSGQVTLTGHVGGTFTTGDVVTLTVGGQTVGTANVLVDGSYSVNVAGSALAGSTAVTASFAAHDTAGALQTVTTTQAYTVDVTPTITVNVPVHDDVTWTEQSGQVAVTGHVGGTFTAGDVVTLTVGNTQATGTVDASGNYSINMAGSALASGTAVTASLAAHDAAGTMQTVSATQSYTVDVTPTITVNVPVHDDVTWTEQSGQVAVTGHVGGTFTAGDVVTLTVGNTSATGTVDASGNYSINMAGSALAGGTAVTASLAAHDAAGALQTVTTTQAYTVDVTPTITVNVPLTNEATWTQPGTQVAVTGHVSGTFTAGDAVTLTVGNTSATGSVDSSGNYTINVAGSALAGNTAVTASLAAHDPAGQLTTASATQNYTVEEAPTITVTVADNNDVTWAQQGTKTQGDENNPSGKDNNNSNNSDGETSLTVPVHGQITGTFTAGDIVTLTVGGTSYTTAVKADGTYSVNVAESALATNSSVTATVAAHDASGALLTATATQSYTVDVTPTISVNLPINNDVTWSEQSGQVAVTGHVSGTFTAGDAVTLTVGDRTVGTGTVAADGSYSIKVNGSDLAGEGHNSITASLTATDSAHQTITVTTQQSYTADNATTLNLNDVNFGEKTDSTATVAGHVNGTFTAGDTVTVTVGTTQITGSVDSHGNFSVGVDKSLLGTGGTVTASLAAHDSAGELLTVTDSKAFNNPVESVATVTVSAPDVTWANESAAGTGVGTVTLSGTTTGATTGTVTVTLEGTAYTGTVNANGTYTIANVPASALVDNTSHSVTATLSATDAAGHTQSVTSAPANYSVESVATVSVSAPDVTWANESAAGTGVGTVTLSGTTTGATTGTVTVTLEGTAYTGTVNANGTYTIANVPASALVDNTSHSVTATLSATDTAGHTQSVTSAPANYGVEAAATITVNATNVTWGNSDSDHLTVSGATTGAHTGDTVTLTVGGTSYTSTVQSDGTYSVNVDTSVMASHSSVTATLSAHDASGTLQTVSASQAYAVETTPTISVNLPMGNDVTWSEQSGQVAVTGHVNGTFTAGDAVTLKVGDTQYTGSVDANGNYSINVAGSVLADHETVKATLTATDSAHQSMTVSAQQDYTVDSTTTIKVNDVNFGDQTDSTATVEGHVKGTYTAGDAVTVTVGTTHITGSVDDQGNFRVGVDKSILGTNGGTVTASLAAHDAAGELMTVTGSKDYNGDNGNSSHASSQPIGNETPAISMDQVGSSGVIDIGTESANGKVAITGTVSGTFQSGDPVTLTVAGSAVGSGTVDGSGHYSINVPVSSLEGSSSVVASVAASDGHGNSTTVTTHQSYSFEAMPQVTIDGLNASYVVNIGEENATATVAVTGTVTGTYQQGDVVTLTVGSQTFTGSVDGSGKYSIGVPGSVLEGSTSIGASVVAHDAQNNSASASSSHAYSVEAMPQITVNPVGDLNISEENSSTNIAVTGHVSGTFSAHDQVTLAVGDHSYTGTVDANGNYSINVPGNVLAANHSMTATIVASDGQGHTATVDPGSQYSVETLPQITISAVGAANEITASDQTAHASVSVSGLVTGTFVAGDVVTLNVGSSAFTGAVGADGSFSIAVSADVLAGATAVNASVAAHDAAGNGATASTSHAYVVDAVPVVPATPAADVTTHTGDASSTTSTSDTTTSASQDKSHSSQDSTTSSGDSGNTGSSDTTASTSQDKGHSSQDSTTPVAATTAPSGDSGASSSTDATTTAQGNSDHAHGHAGSDSSSASAQQTVETPPQISISAVAGSDEITAAEQTAHASLAVSGSVTGAFTAGDVVTLNVGSNTFSGAVGADGSFNISVSADVLSGSSSVSASVVAHDASGNSNTASTSHSYVVDVVPSVPVASDPSTLHVNDVLSTSSGDLLQNLPSTPASTSTTTTTTPATDTSGATGGVLVDAEALKALANSLTAPSSSHGHHG